MVTMWFNVPRNNKLARLTPTAPEAISVWRDYLITWTAWNHVRTIASLAARSKPVWSKHSKPLRIRLAIQCPAVCSHRRTRTVTGGSRTVCCVRGEHFYHMGTMFARHKLINTPVRKVSLKLWTKDWPRGTNVRSPAQGKRSAFQSRMSGHRNKSGQHAKRAIRTICAVTDQFQRPSRSHRAKMQALLAAVQPKLTCRYESLWLGSGVGRPWCRYYRERGFRLHLDLTKLAPST